MLSYNINLFFTKDRDKNFSIIRFQTNNTLNIRIEAFIYKKKAKSIEAKFKAKL